MARVARAIRRALAVLPMCTGAASAHPIHTTLTVVRYDAAQGAITVSIRAFADDFSAAVARAAGKPVPRDWASPDGDITSYVRTKLVLEGVRLEPCGTQRTTDAYLLCFRASVPAGTREIRGRNLMLTELHADQVNIVQSQAGAARSTHLFTKASQPAVIFGG